MKTIFNLLHTRIMALPTSIMMRFFVLSALTAMFFSCNESLEVDIKPVEPPVTVYNTAKCTYYGVLSDQSGACFLLELYQSSNPASGIAIMGYSTKPTNFASFKLDAGTYMLATNGAAKTYAAGMKDGENITGTRLFNTASNTFTLVKSGTFTVGGGASSYSVTTNFSGMDSKTGAIVNNISISFAGTISFVDESKVVLSTYTATGTPKWLTVPGDGTWIGTIKTGTLDDGSEYITISNWGNDDIEVFCDYENGVYTIDDYSTVAHNDTYDGKFKAGYITTNNALVVLDDKDYVVKYNPITRILDFSGTIIDAGAEHEALLGVRAKNKTTGVYGSVFTDFYSGVKLKLTPTK